MIAAVMSGLVEASGLFRSLVLFSSLMAEVNIAVFCHQMEKQRYREGK